LSLDCVGIRRSLARFAVGSTVALSAAIVGSVVYLLEPANARGSAPRVPPRCSAPLSWTWCWQPARRARRSRSEGAIVALNPAITLR
jgi:hypothetical protein